MSKLLIFTAIVGILSLVYYALTIWATMVEFFQDYPRTEYEFEKGEKNFPALLLSLFKVIILTFTPILNVLALIATFLNNESLSDAIYSGLEEKCVPKAS